MCMLGSFSCFCCHLEASFTKLTFGGLLSECQTVNKANTSDTEASFLDLHLTISNDIVSTKIYNKRENFEFVNLP